MGSIHSFGDAATGKHYAEITDGTARFSVRSNGYIEVLSDEYGNKGTIYKPGPATYDQMIKNLSAYSAGQKNTIASVIGTRQFAESMASPVVVTPSGRPATPAELSPPLYQRWWFAPAAGVSVLGLGVALLVFKPWQRFGR